MAGLEGLASMIYHEKQQPGSMLCAQHALNNLLQGNYFTAPDLSAIATELDQLEESYDDDNMGRESTNMDDTGFFSVQVLEDALKVWGLHLVRWRGESMRPYHDNPHTQLAFILNQSQHWFTLRRFGPALPSLEADPGAGHWFNLNSSLPAPEWVSKLYLGMVLHQAEQEGYSVFAVTQADPTASLALPRTDADDIAMTLPEPSAAGNRLSTSHTLASSGPLEGLEGLEDEDMELQRALQASLMGGGADELIIPSGGPSSAPAGATGVRTPTQGNFDMPGAFGGAEEEDGMGADMVAASMARSRALFERMRREQEAALRGSYDEEIARIEELARHQAPGGSTSGGGAEEDEDEMVRRAIEESRRARGDADDEDDDGDENAPPLRQPIARDFVQTHRLYDDEDAELQAALRASLEDVPEGFQVPSPPPRATLPEAVSPATTSAAQAPSTLTGIAQRVSETMDEDEDEGSSMVSEQSEPEAPAPAPVVDHDEMRRLRLARFGA